MYFQCTFNVSIHCSIDRLSCASWWLIHKSYRNTHPIGCVVRVPFQRPNAILTSRGSIKQRFHSSVRWCPDKPSSIAPKPGGDLSWRVAWSESHLVVSTCRGIDGEVESDQACWVSRTIGGWNRQSRCTGIESDWKLKISEICFAKSWGFTITSYVGCRRRIAWSGFCNIS